jgi:cysteine-rich repeat protein
MSILLIVVAAVAEARVVTIRWTNPNSSAVSGFRIYARGASQSFGAPAYDGNPVAVASVYSIQLTISDVTGTYVAATAYNSAGESARSNELFYAAPVCGNAVVDAGEQCDDGNKTAGDGCSATCQIEVAVCGNGILQTGEACDDGNKTAGDGCSATCQIEVAVCGNGIREFGEACDDGNKTAGDGCSATCQIEVAVCGNGIREFGEGCDDGNVVGGDGCSASCVVEANPNAPSAYLIDVGGPGFTTSSGQVWLPDTNFASGGHVAVSAVPIGQTNNDRLYQTRRDATATDQPLMLEFPVPGTGPYRIRLHFAELDAAITQPGMRVFNVVVEDVFELSDVDVFKSVGFARAYSRYFFVNVDDGVLTLRFEPVVGKPMLAGIEISEQAPPTSAPEFVDPCVESPANCQ